jgi:hypothetical protein
MNQKKIFIIISSDIFVRNYINSGAFSKLEAEYDCHYLISNKVSISSPLKNLNHNFYELDPLTESTYAKIFHLTMMRSLHLSKSFPYRHMRLKASKSSLSELAKQHKLFTLIKLLILKIISFLEKIILKNDFAYNLYKSFLINRISFNEFIVSMLAEHSPELVIYPSSAYDPDGVEISRVCEELKLKSLFLVDNWDNLSSKSILWHKPNYITVWGPQSKIHAIDIQGFKDSQVTNIGTPRFEKYFELRDTEIKSMFDFKYILFVGSSLPFDEANVLAKLDHIVDKNLSSLGNVKIIYRPHPWRMGKDSINDLSLKHVILDPQLKDSYSQGLNSTTFQPSLDYYPSLIKNAEFVTGGLTSMLIEASIFRKNFLGLAHIETDNVTSPNEVLNNFTHFDGIQNIDTINFCYNLDDLESKFMNLLLESSPINSSNLEKQLSFFYFNDGYQYSERLGRLCKELCT